MKIIMKADCKISHLPGRDIWKVVGKDSFSFSEKISFGYARFSYVHGLPEPHHHAEEICHVLDCSNAFVRFGSAEDSLGNLVPLENGMSLHIPEMEWHQFVCEEGGFLDILFIYGQVGGLRPEESRS